MSHKTLEARRAYAKRWRERNRAAIRERHREYMREWLRTKAGRAWSARRPRKTARRVAWWHRP